MYRIIKADIIEWLKDYQDELFHAMLFDPPYHLTSITERFGKDGSKPAREGIYKRSGAGFMGKSWDGGDLIFQPETWESLSTILHPSAFVMAYCSSRGWHRQAIAMEDGGFIFHPSLFMFGMAFGSGFPKATRIDTQIDAMAGEERKVVDSDSNFGITKLEDGKTTFGDYEEQWTITKPATPLAETWQGHRYSLQCIKPALEPILVGQKLYQGKPVENITKTGAGAINVGGGRIGADWNTDPNNRGLNQGFTKEGDDINSVFNVSDRTEYDTTKGRWPANLILHHLPECKQVGTKRIKPHNGSGVVGDTTNSPKTTKIYGEYKGIQQRGFTHTDSDGYETITEWQCAENCPVKIVGEQSGEKDSRPVKPENVGKSGSGEKRGLFSNRSIVNSAYYDSGTAARYFYQPDWSYEICEQLNNTDLLQYIIKPSTTEREAGLEKVPIGNLHRMREGGGGLSDDPKFAPVERKNTHPTVKSIALNKYLATLLLPPVEYAPRRILVPFAGSGSEVIGCLLAGWDEVIGIELEQEYYDIASERVAWWQKVMESCNYEVNNIIKLWQEEQRIKESGQMRLL